MSDQDFDKLLLMKYAGGGWLPGNENAEQISDTAKMDSELWVLEVGNRDLNFHRCYMSLVSHIWDFMPPPFKTKVPKKHFYQWLKHLKRNYSVIYSFKDDAKREEIKTYLKENKKKFRITYKTIDTISEMFGKLDLVDYDSISFGRMSQQRFEDYVREQLPWIYEQVIGKFYKDELYNEIIDQIEDGFKKFLSKL